MTDQLPTHNEQINRLLDMAIQMGERQGQRADLWMHMATRLHRAATRALTMLNRDRPDIAQAILRKLIEEELKKVFNDLGPDAMAETEAEGQTVIQFPGC